MFTFCSLLGAQSESAASQSLLELDGGVKVLIDVGWDESFDVTKLKELEKQVPTLSIILLTHPTVSHLAAFAHCCKHFPLFTRIPIYATLPVISLGRTLLQDLYTSTPLASTVIPTSSLAEASYTYSQSNSAGGNASILLQPPTSEEIASYFSLIHPLKYSQPHQPLPSPFSPPLNGLTITAYNAGHTLGGTIWHIQHGLESIVYAVDWNQARENVLAGAAWLGGAGGGGGEVIEQLRKPTALICSSRGGERAALPGGRAKRDELLLEMIKSAARRGGIVLIPTDSSARVLELAYLLEHAWRIESKDDNSPLQASKLYLASKNIGATMRYARSMLEWMDDGIIREFEANTGVQQAQTSGTKDSKQAGPFDFRHLRLLERKGQIDRVLNETDNLGRTPGKVILASDTSLEWGFSREVLRKIADDSRNLIILTERMGQPEPSNPKPGLATTLWSWWEERKNGVATEATKNGESLEQVYSGGNVVELREAKRIALEGNDLNVYQQWLANERQLQSTLQSGGATSLESSADVVDDGSSDSSSDSDDSETEQQGKALNISATMGQANRKKIGLSDEDLGINILLRKKGVYDYDVRGKKGREKMFPLAIRRKRNDDFGELIRPEDFLRAEERDEINGQDMRQQPGKYDTKDTLGKKRKFDDVGLPGERRLSDSLGKRRQLNSTSQETFDLPDMAPGVEDDASDDEAEEEVTGPSRLEFSTEKLSIHVRLAFVDFAGLHDKRSLQMLIPLIQPRKLILVSGMKDETLALANDCRKLLAAHTGSSEASTFDVYTPIVGAIVDASVDTNAWAVKLTDALVRGLKWQNVKGLSIATLTARLEGSTPDLADSKAEGSNKKQKLLKNEPEGPTIPQNIPAAITEIPKLDILPSNMVSATRSVAQPLQVGDLRLADLRKIMQSSGHTAEFRGEGMLLIDGNVIVRKTGTGRIEVESVGIPMGISSAMANMTQGSTFFAVKTTLASFREETFECSLPFPIAKVVLTHQTLVDHTNIASTVTFSSLAIYNISGHRIAYIKQVRAIITAQHGWNPIHGRDLGLPPSAFSSTNPYFQDSNFMSGFQGFQGFQGFPTNRGYNPGSGYDPLPGPPGLAGPPQQQVLAQQPVYYQQPVYQTSQQPIVYQQPSILPQPVYQQPYGGQPIVAPYGAVLQPVSAQNTQGVPFIPPGYRYLPYLDNCLIHIFNTTEKPWQILVDIGNPLTHTKWMVPDALGVKDFMQHIGCTNEDPKKNIMYEVVEKGNGRWAPGLKVCGDDKDKVKKKLKDFGWDKTRTGMAGQKPIVWLWMTKDGE